MFMYLSVVIFGKRFRESRISENDVFLHGDPVQNLLNKQREKYGFNWVEKPRKIFQIV